MKTRWARVEGSIPGPENNHCQNLETGNVLVCPRIKGATVAEAEEGMSRVTEDEVSQVK